MDIDGKPKILKVLNKILEPNFNVKHDSYLSALFTHITDQNVLPEDDFVQWMERAIIQWETTEKCPSSDVLSFILNITSHKCMDEQVFVKLNSANVFRRLITLMEINKENSQASPTTMLAFVKLVSSLLEHKASLQWIISTNHWQSALKLSLGSHTVYISKEGYKFVAKLLEKSLDINETFCTNVVNLIMTPLFKISKLLSEHIEVNFTEISDIKEQKIYKYVSPSLRLIVEVFEILLQKCTTTNNFKVILLFKEKFELEKSIQKMLLAVHYENFLLDLNKILLILYFINIYHKYRGKKTVLQDAIVPAAEECTDIILNLTDGDTVSNKMQLCYSGYVYWKIISDRMAECLSKDKRPLLVENQLLVIQVCPIFMVGYKLRGHQPRMVEGEDEIRNGFITKLFKNISVHTYKAIYKWKKYLLNQFSYDNAILSLENLLRTKQFLNHELGITAFQCAVYNMKDMVYVSREQPEQIVTFLQQSNYFALLFETVGELVKEFNLTWKDSYESICIMNLVYELLELTTWPIKVVVKGLELINITIWRYMSPDMALLLDKAEYSIMDQLGNFLNAKLHDPSCEVRDIALEVVRTISHNANTKFPSYREVVLKTDLPSLVLKMALYDGEAFVRASALRCLKEMTEVGPFWLNLFDNGSIFNKIIIILQTETEGIVRSEAASLMEAIYEHQYIPQEILIHVYNIMTHAVIADVHWEVKVKALTFWNKVIERHLMDQGMIDGIFPEVTFSKEKKKIVTLNELEVKKRLVKVLRLLSETGCLAVFVSALQDDCDIEVSKAALDLIGKFVTLLKTYNITPVDVTVNTPNAETEPSNSFVPEFNSNSIDSQYSSLSPPSPMNDSDMTQSSVMADTVVDSILNTRDLSLLNRVFNSLDIPSNDYVGIKSRQVLEPWSFVNFVCTDLQSRFDEKKRGINDIDSLDSLLDDILKGSDVNGVDCC